MSIFKKKNKILIILLVIMLLSNTFIPCISIANYELGSDIVLRGYGSVEQHLRNRESGDYMVTTDLVGYYDNGIFYPAYCLNRDKSGADNEFSHTVNLADLLADEETYNKIWRVVTARIPISFCRRIRCG